MNLYSESEALESMHLMENRGLELADRYFKELLEDIPGEKRFDLNDQQRSHAAILMANTARATNIPLDRVESLFQEDLTTGDVAAFNKFAFPIIRTLLPQMAATSLCSVQPMLGPTSQIFYLRYYYDTTKGAITAGTEMFAHRDRYYASSTVYGEGVGTGNAVLQHFSGVLAHTPIVAGTVSFVYGAVVIYDDGLGSILSTDGVTVIGTVNYTSGVYGVTMPTVPANLAAITVNYKYASETSTDVGKVKIQLASTAVTADTYKLKSVWSIEAQQDLLAVHGITAAVELTAAIGSEVRFEIDQDIIRSIEAYALNAQTDTAAIAAGLSPVVVGATHYAWDKTPPTGVAWVDHKEQFLDVLNEQANYVFQTTGRARPNWLVVASNLLSLCQGHPSWQRATVDLTYGIYNAGTLGDYMVFVDPDMTSNQFLLGYKGPSFLHAGYVWGPYVPIYWTPTVELADMTVQKGAMSRSGKSAVNNFFVKNVITQS
jgi:hypothetical protein